MNFHTSLKFNDRPSKQRYIADKFAPLFTKEVLDIGADEGYLKSFIPENVKYVGVGLGGQNEDIVKLNLEKEKLPFEDASFQTVMCMDVLEHLENIHQVMDDLCRVSSQYVLISLPNPFGDFISAARTSSFKNDEMIKFYGLPHQKPVDRHKWFFGTKEAQSFITSYAEKNGYDVSFYEQTGLDVPFVKNIARKALFAYMKNVLKNKDIQFEDIFGSTMWWVLKRKESN